MTEKSYNVSNWSHQHKPIQTSSNLSLKKVDNDDIEVTEGLVEVGEGKGLVEAGDGQGKGSRFFFTMASIS